MFGKGWDKVDRRGMTFMQVATDKTNPLIDTWAKAAQAMGLKDPKKVLIGLTALVHALPVLAPVGHRPVGVDEKESADTFSGQIGLISAPVGMNLFVLDALLDGVGLQQIFRGVWLASFMR